MIAVKFIDYMMMVVIPVDNPFVKDRNAKKAFILMDIEIRKAWSMHPETGEIWTHEHGPRGGDEINIIKSGKNYGWPTNVSYGVNYQWYVNSQIIQSLPGMEQPFHYWDTFYCTKRYDVYHQ